jgi:ATP-dependent DNA ligase
LISRNGNRIWSCSTTPGGLSSTGCFGRGRPTYAAFDLLMADGIDLRPLPLRERKARLATIGKRTEGWIALTNGVVGEGRAL